MVVTNRNTHDTSKLGGIQLNDLGTKFPQMSSIRDDISPDIKSIKLVLIL